jgi:hypothetical protein
LAASDNGLAVEPAIDRALANSGLQVAEIGLAY